MTESADSSMPRPERVPIEPPAGTNWRRLHPVTFLLDILKLARSFALPLIIVVFVQSTRDGNGNFLWFVLVASLLGLLGSLARVLSVRYVVYAGRLFIYSGILFRSQRTIPVDRIQNLNHESGPLHRLFGVVEVRIETAGSGGSEASLAVIDREDAEILRKEILDARSETIEEGPEPYLLRRSSLSEILLAGATETRVGLLLALVWMVYEVAAEAGADERSIAGFLMETFSAIHLPLWVAAGAGLLAAIMFGWVASILMTLLSDYGFELSRLGNDLKKRHGLLTRVETTAPIPRVQGIAADGNVLRILLGWRRVRVDMAGSARDAQRAGAMTLTPLIPLIELAPFCRVVYPSLDLTQMSLERVHRLALRRGFSRAFLFGAIPIAISAAVFADARWLYGLIALVPLAALWSIVRYRVLGYATTGRFLVLRHGVLRQRLAVLPEQKIQTVAVRRSPIQRLLGLASLHFSTAGSGPLAHLVIPDLGESVANLLFEKLSLEASRGVAL